MPSYRRAWPRRAKIRRMPKVREAIALIEADGWREVRRFLIVIEQAGDNFSAYPLTFQGASRPGPPAKRPSGGCTKRSSCILQDWSRTISPCRFRRRSPNSSSSPRSDRAFRKCPRARINLGLCLIRFGRRKKKEPGSFRHRARWSSERRGLQNQAALRTVAHGALRTAHSALCLSTSRPCRHRRRPVGLRTSVPECRRPSLRSSAAVTRLTRRSAAHCARIPTGGP